MRSLLGILLLGFLAGSAALLAPGCGGSGEGRGPLTSRLFSHAEVIGTRGTGPGQFSKPRSLTVDRDDNLYVVDMTGRVQKFSPAGHYLDAWQMEESSLGKPKGMCVDREGQVVVVEPHYSRVTHYQGDGVRKIRWGRPGTNAGALSFPRDIACNSQGALLICEYGAVERVQKFAGPGGPLAGACSGVGLGPGQFNRAEGLAVDGSDRVYVADSCNHRIQVFDPELRPLRSYGRAGTRPGEFSYPYDVCVDADGRQYICEFGNSRIQVFDAQDRLLECLGEPGALPGQFNNPWSIALDSRGNLYVADSQNHRVQKLVRR